MPVFRGEEKQFLNFQKKIYLFSQEISYQLKDALRVRFARLGREKLSNPIHTLLSEMVINGIKATHKKLYYKYVVRELSSFLTPDKITYEKWLRLFMEEIEANQYKNLNRFAKKEKKYVHVAFKPEEQSFLISVENFGIPIDVEKERINNLLEFAKGTEDLSYLFEDNDEVDSKREGAGLGLGLIIMTLRNLGIEVVNFDIGWKNDKTTSCLRLPWEVFDKE